MIVLLWICPNAVFAIGVGDRVPKFDMVQLDGTKIESEDIIGNNPILLVFWATWCPNCKKEIPTLKKIYQEFNPKGMKILAINVGVNDTRARAVKYKAKYKIDYPVVFDIGSRFTRSVNVQGVPTVIVVDKKGIVRYRSYVVPEDLDNNFDELMK
jgi:peroxiredoxin